MLTTMHNKIRWCVGYHISAVVKNSNASEHNFNVSRDQNYDFLNICVQGLSPTKQSFDVSMDVDRSTNYLSI